MILSVVPTVGAGTPDCSGTGEVSVFWDRWDTNSACIAGWCKPAYYSGGARTQNLYTAAELANYDVQAGPVGEIGWVNAWGKTSTWAGGYWPGYNHFLNLRITISNVPATKTSLYSTFTSNYGPDGGVIVYYQPGWTTLDGYHNQFFWFDISSSGFIYEGNGLVVEVAYDQISGSTAYYGSYWSFLTGYWGANPYIGLIWYYWSGTNSYGYSYSGNIQVMGFKVSAIPAYTRIEPQSLNLDSNGNWVNVKVEGFPENPEYTPMDVDGTSVAVAGNGVDLKFGTWNENRWIGKCDRLMVEDSIGSPGEEVEISVTGSLNDGTAFMSTATIKAIQN
jgi:hypothetical protein